MRFVDYASIAALYVAAGCASIQGNTEDVAPTWDKALVALPGGSFLVGPAKASVASPLPTVILLHSCYGIAGHEMQWAGTFIRAGYAVIMLDSFARKNRRADCDPTRGLLRLFPDAHRLRQQEIAYALQQLDRVPWIKRRAVFLMGDGEGGGAVSRWDGGGFTAHIISGWKCGHTHREFDGPRASADTPMLAINHESDPYLQDRGWSSCAARFGSYKDAREIVLPGHGHDTHRLHLPAAVVEFVRRHTPP